MLSRSRGLSLVELMITITLGLLLMAALTAVFSNTLGVNSRSLKLSQLNEEAVTLMYLIEGDVKRTGYRGDAAELIYDPTNASTAFNNTLTISQLSGEALNSCILFSYDVDGDGVHDGNSENFGYRLSEQKVQRRRDSATCDEGGWEDLTANDLVTVDALTFTLTEQMIDLVNEQMVSIQLDVSLPSDSEITRTLTNDVVIRNAF